MAGEAYSGSGEEVQEGARVALVPIAAQPLGAQCVDHDEEDVEVVALPEPLDVVCGAQGPVIPLARKSDPDEHRQQDDDDGGGDENQPTLCEYLL